MTQENQPTASEGYTEIKADVNPNPPKTIQDWRNQDISHLNHYAVVNEGHMWSRIDIGIERYGAGQPGSLFKGDPLEHAVEEVYDLPFYLHYAKLQRDYLIGLLEESARLFRDIGHKMPGGYKMQEVNQLKQRIYDALANAQVHIKKQ